MTAALASRQEHHQVVENTLRMNQDLYNGGLPLNPQVFLSASFPISL